MQRSCVITKRGKNYLKRSFGIASCEGLSGNFSALEADFFFIFAAISDTETHALTP